MDSKKKSLLEQRLHELNIYDLERLRECFEYELKIRPHHKEEIEEILSHIMQEIDQKASL